MNKFIAQLAVLLLLTAPAFAQKEKKVDPKHANHFKVAKVETDDYIVEVTDIFVRMEEAKCKVKITNKTNDYLLWNPSESVFKFEFGEFKPKEKEVIIKPNDKESKVLNVSGDNRFHVETLSLDIKGMSKVAATGTMVMAPDFQLPASMNDFTAGPFKVSLLAVDKKTDLTSGTFRVTYTGNDIGLVDANKIAVRTEKEQEFASARTDYKLQLLKKGDDDKFNFYFKVPASHVDMQFATMWIIFRNAFQESKKVAISGTSVVLEFDPVLTKEKN